MAAKIVFNGTEYSSVEEMPPEARQAYEQMMRALGDNNQNGLPDMFEQMISAEAGLRSASVNLVNFNGQNYSNLEQMPPEVREAYQRAMGALNLLGDNNQNGIPDIVEGAMNMQAQPFIEVHSSAAPASVAPSVYPTAPKPPVSSLEVEASDRNLRLLIVGGGILLVLGMIAVLLAIVVVNQYLR